MDKEALDIAVKLLDKESLLGSVYSINREKRCYKVKIVSIGIMGVNIMPMSIKDGNPPGMQQFITYEQFLLCNPKKIL